MTLLLLAGPEMVVGGLALMFSNPYFFRPFPPAYCNSSNHGPNGIGVVVLVLGLLLLAVPIGVAPTGGSAVI